MARITIGGMGTASIEHMTLKTHTLLLEQKRFAYRNKKKCEIRKNTPGQHQF